MPVTRGACAAGSSIFASRHSTFGTGPAIAGVCRPKANHPGITAFTSAPEVRALSSAGATRLHRSYDPVRRPLAAPSKPALRPLPSRQTVSPDCPHHTSGVPCPLSRRIERSHASIASPSVRPSPFCRRVGIRVSTFEACSGFTRITARRDCSTAQGGLRNEAPAKTVTRPSRSSATGSIDNSPGGTFLHW